MILSNLSSFNKTLELEKYVIPKNEENLNDIFEQIKKLIQKELNLNKFLIIFSDNIFDRYIELYKKGNIEELILIYKIMNLIKKKIMFQKLIKLIKLKI